jgi:(p)ppGpp synthase/HD superfamily hydrolase
MDKYAKLEISLRYWLLGKGYYRALEAMEFAKSYHTGFRKDGVTPEFQHQLEIAHYARTLSGIIDMESLLCVIFLHDVPEDYGVAIALISARFGEHVGNAVWAMTKKFNGVERDENELFHTMARDPLASIAKGCDRDHNLKTMVGVFLPGKQISYCDFAEERIIPMLKEARRLFPQQELAYENIKHVLTGRIALIRAMHEPELEAA